MLWKSHHKDFFSDDLYVLALSAKFEMMSESPVFHAYGYISKLTLQIKEQDFSKLGNN